MPARQVPKADIHRHAETYAHLDRLIAARDGRPPYDWEGSVERLAELPPGMPRLARLNGDLDTAALHPIAVSYVRFVEYTTAIMRDAASDGAVLLEIRFGVGAGLGPDHMSLFREAERRVREEYPDFHAEAIGLMRPTPDEADAFETCLSAREQGLAGIDFVPDPLDTEADWTVAYRWAERAAEAGLGITAHAAEFSTANLAAALRMPGITRIGHGVYAAAGDELLRQVVGSGVTVECCLTSNVVLGAVPSLEEHPIRDFVEAGVPVTLCTDDPVRLCTDIAREYERAESLGFGTDDLRAFTRNGVLASFTSPRAQVGATRPPRRRVAGLAGPARNPRPAIAALREAVSRTSLRLPSGCRPCPAAAGCRWPAAPRRRGLRARRGPLSRRRRPPAAAP